MGGNFSLEEARGNGRWNCLGWLSGSPCKITSLCV